MEDSILKSVKKILNIDPEDDTFDLDVIIHINSAFSTLCQLGIGPEEGFAIEDEDTTWDDYLDSDPRLNSIKTYVCLKTRVVFDPPTTSYAIGAIEKQIEELEWRISVNREATGWTDPEEVVS